MFSKGIGRMISRALCLIVGLGMFASTANGADLISLHVYMQPMARALPFYVGIEKEFFVRRGLKVELEFTKSSANQRDALANGKADIVYSAVDNAVAMVEVGKKDVVIVTGGDSGTNELYVQDYVKKFSDIRGHAVAVDATNTAYALQAKKILLQHGLKDDADYKLNPVGNGSLRLKSMIEDKNNAAAILNLPYSLQAKTVGLKSMGRTIDMIGPYQAAGSFTLRSWATANSSTLEQYIAALVESLRWSLDLRNRPEAVAILIDKFKLSTSIAERSYDLMSDPAFGFAPDAKLNMDGFKNVLALRAEIEGRAPAAPGRYVDLNYYERAMSLAN
jgi:ABC-type nitrate/sulfonate/bicarbonate transport system substrate-binding protein